MKLISCENPECGIVLDADQIHWPRDFENSEDSNMDEYEWDGDSYVARISCPVCGNTILKSKQK